MSTGSRMSILCVVIAAFLLPAHLGEAGAVTATPDQYDPRLDPNYSLETSERTPVNWEAIWGLVREFEARTYLNVDRPQATAPYAQPQPWQYVQGVPTFSGSPPIPDVPSYEGPYAGSWYAYGPLFSGFWEPSPRIPWWSLIPPRTHHRRGHQRVSQHRGWHHEAWGRRHW